MAVQSFKSQVTKIKINGEWTKADLPAGSPVVDIRLWSHGDLLR